jgi:hypothetical protein
MANQTPRVLLTGDYWHSDFQGLIASTVCVTTLVPEDKVTNEHLSVREYDLVVVAASRPNQFSASWIESLRATIAPTPVVALLGSWCEGEQRSGDPWPGVKRVYWHQWRGRFDFFASELGDLQVGIWNLPATANDADTIDHILKGGFDASIGNDWNIGISSLSEDAYQMLQDALQTLNSSTCWIERQQWDAQATEQLTAVCVEADTWNETVEARIEWLRDDLEIDAPIILLLNFPRKNDVQAAKSAGVIDVVSKPFQLPDIAAAIDRSINQNA